MSINIDRKLRRKLRVSANIYGMAEKPRLNVFRSNKYIYIQAVNDRDKTTLVSYSSLKLQHDKKNAKTKKTEEAKNVGLIMAKKLIEKGVKQAVFDRGRYAYKGRVKALAEGLREGGLKV
ncbi:50S ribosomal protein L18 [Candidatus Roizmanbacteria bacterium]|nr:50S ribosomal protein L18 [Candidatus Roizmanbacteria bacterium]